MRELFNLNNDWIYLAKKSPALSKTKKIPKLYDEVTLPHCLGNDIVYDYTKKAIKAAPDGERKAGVCGSLDNNIPKRTIMWYRRDISIEPRLEGKRIYLEFEGACGKCEVYFNGKLVGKHSLAAIPFRINVTKRVSFTKVNTLAVKVDCRDDKSSLPGAPLDKMRIIKFGGLDRGVNLLAKEEIHFTENDYMGKHGGGTYLYDERLEPQQAVLGSKVNIANRTSKKAKAVVTVTIIDMKGETVAAYTTPEASLKPNDSDTLDCSVHLDNPIFWTMNYPYLYTVKYELYANGGLMDTIEIKHGFRMAKVDHRGFIFNGVKMQLRGINRAEQAPYIGQALSDSAAYRDAYKIKKAGFNIVRLDGGSHSEAFLSACDELGLLVLQTLPVADIIAKSGDIQDNIIRAIRAMVRRDRNHTSVVMWEPSVSGENTKLSDKFYIECKSVFQEEFLNNANILIAGDVEGRKQPKKLNYALPYTTLDELTLAPQIKSLPGRKGLVKNYGDKELGGEYSTSRAGRSAPEGAQLLQAWNYQWSHNSNMESKRVLGDMLASNVDYLQGVSKDFKYCRSGLMDLYRLPKFSYQFFRSQDLRPTQKMVFAPTYWDDPCINVLPVYSNCDKVRLYFNGEFIEERAADNGETDLHTATVANDNIAEIKKQRKDMSAVFSKTRYWALKQHYEKVAITTSPMAKFLVDTMYNGGNCKKIAQAPFTFRDIIYRPGELRVDGIVDGKVVARHVVNTPGDAVKLRLQVDYSAKELVADRNDFLYIHAEIVDDKGTIVRGYNSEVVEFTAENGDIIGRPDVVPEGGIASSMIRAHKMAERVVVNVTCNGLIGQRVEIKVKAATNAIS